MPNRACLCGGVILSIFCGPLAIRSQLSTVSNMPLSSCVHVRYICVFSSTICTTGKLLFLCLSEVRDLDSQGSSYVSPRQTAQALVFRFFQRFLHSSCRSGSIDPHVHKHSSFVLCSLQPSHCVKSSMTTSSVMSVFLYSLCNSAVRSSASVPFFFDIAVTFFVTSSLVGEHKVKVTQFLMRSSFDRC